MLYAPVIAMRMLLLMPIALCLALLIVVDSQVLRGLLVAAIVFLEIIRDAVSLSQAASQAVMLATPRKKPKAPLHPVRTKTSFRPLGKKTPFHLLRKKKRR